MADHLVELDDRWSLWRRFAVRGTGLPIDFVDAFAVPELLEGAVPDDSVRSRTAEAFWAALADDTFVAALAWQNPSIVRTWAGRLAAMAGAGGDRRLSRRNERERVVARYAQRYATKNESIGFFGPVAWGTFGGERALHWHGTTGIRSSTVSFEVWAIAELAEAWARDPEIRPHTPVRLNPSCSVDGLRVQRPRRAPVELPAAVIAAACSGTTHAELLEIAGSEALAELVAAEVLLVGFPIPFDEHPERHLRAQVQAIADPAVAERLHGHLDRLDAARDWVAKVARDPHRVPDAIAELGAAVVAAGGTATRAIGKHGLGRTAVYLDCRRDLDVAVGAGPLAELAGPLGILLDTADWLAAEVAGAVEDGLRERWRELRRDHEVVSLARLLTAATDLLVPGNATAAAVAEDFRLRWAEVLPTAGEGPVRLSSARVRALVDVLFPRATPRWAAARHHTPDLMLAAGPRGPQWVLGELHVALNTVESRLFATQCDWRGELVEATKTDFAGGRLVPLYPPRGVANNSRTYPPPALDPPGGFDYWSYTDDSGHEHGHGSTSATVIEVRELDGELVGVAHGRAARVLEYLGEFLTAVVVNLFTLRPRSPHLPRVLIDDVVVCRESWTFPAAEIPLPSSRPSDYSYQCLRDWARQRGLPRRVFVHVPGEPKPVYADFAAPALLDNLARMIRPLADHPVSFIEMLPGPESLWLTDDRGRPHTTEFRVVAVRSAVPEPVFRPLP